MLRNAFRIFRELREKKKQAKILKKQEAERLAGQQMQEGQV